MLVQKAVVDSQLVAGSLPLAPRVVQEEVIIWDEVGSLVSWLSKVKQIVA